MKVVRFSTLLTDRRYPLGIFLVLISVRGGRKDYVNEKFQSHHRESEPATFRLVAQCLNQMRHRYTERCGDRTVVYSQGQQLSAAGLINLRLFKHDINPFCMQSSPKCTVTCSPDDLTVGIYFFARTLREVMDLLRRKRKTA